MIRTRYLCVVFAVALMLAACSSDPGESTTEGEDNDESSEEALAMRDETYHIITHARPGDSFWDVLKKGGEQAAEDLGVEVKYSNDEDVASQAALIATAVGEGSDGIAVSTGELDGLREEIGNAVAAGIPVITINATEDIEGTGVMTHVGQSERVAGQGAGRQMADLGATRVLCLIHEVGTTILEDRCAGAEEYVEIVRLQVSGPEEINATQNEIQAKLQADQSIDGLLSLNRVVALASIEALNGAGIDIVHGTFDNSGDVSDAIKAGDIAFAIDQQQYLQGYLPIVLMHLNTTNLNSTGGGKPIHTGPGLVTKENVDEVTQKAAEGTR